VPDAVTGAQKEAPQSNLQFVSSLLSVPKVDLNRARQTVLASLTVPSPLPASGSVQPEPPATNSRRFYIQPLVPFGSRFNGVLPKELTGNVYQSNYPLHPMGKHAVAGSGYGLRIHPILGEKRFHHGIDYPANEGTPVVAPTEMKIVSAGWDQGHGNLVIATHGKYQYRFAHLSKILVAPGTKVSPGTPIGEVGSTGWSTGPHLHWEVRQLKDTTISLDPKSFLKKPLASPFNPYVAQEAIAERLLRPPKIGDQGEIPRLFQQQFNDTTIALRSALFDTPYACAPDLLRPLPGYPGLIKLSESTLVAANPAPATAKPLAPVTTESVAEFQRRHQGKLGTATVTETPTGIFVWPSALDPRNKK